MQTASPFCNNDHKEKTADSFFTLSAVLVYPEAGLSFIFRILNIGIDIDAILIHLLPNAGGLIAITLVDAAIPVYARTNGAGLQDR